MAATRNGTKYVKKCEWCDQFFATNSRRAKFCCDAHRLSAHRAKKSGDGRTLHDLDALTTERLQQIHTVSEPAYNAIFRLLEKYGARVATEAIRASFFVLDTMYQEMEKANA